MKRSTGPDESALHAIENHLAGTTPEFREALQRLRDMIRSEAPDAVETISYQMPAFKLDGKLLACYAAFKKHCSYFPIGSTPVEPFQEEAAPFWTSKGTLQFTPDHPMPEELVRKVVRKRIEEIRSKR